MWQDDDDEEDDATGYYEESVEEKIKYLQFVQKRRLLMRKVKEPVVHQDLILAINLALYPKYIRN